MQVILIKYFCVSAVCGIGLKRQNNEDNLCIDRLYLDEAAVETTKNAVFEYSSTFSGSLFAAVCDGMGGEMAGEQASQIAVRELAALPAQSGEQEIFDRLRAISSKLNSEAQALGASCIGCTAAVLSLSGDSATVINVGDSRVYRLRKRKLEQLSHDQSEVQSYIDAGVLSEKKARSHPLRHKILKFLGMPEDKLDFEPAKQSEIKSGDAYLICSDGLTECLEDKKICAMLRSGASARRLYDAAMDKGGVDNTTIIIIRAE